MVGYTPYKSVAIYPFSSSNVTKFTPTCLSQLHSIPGTGVFKWVIFWLGYISFLLLLPFFLFSFFIVWIPSLWVFKCPSTVGFRTSRCLQTMLSPSPDHDANALRCIAAIHVFLPAILYCCHYSPNPSGFLLVCYWIHTVQDRLGKHSMCLFDYWILLPLPPCSWFCLLLQ